MQVFIKRLSTEVPIPEYKTPGACAFDIAVSEGVTLPPGGRALLPTGLIVQVPPDYTLVLAPRSSNSKKGIRLGNGIGIIDQDYHGPSDQLFAAVHNFSNESYTIEKGERIMQGMIVPIVRAEFVEREELSASDRGGFGSTG
jgi:dUTP pyrophosphatase